MPFGLFQAVDRADVRMIERREKLRLALEARDALGIDARSLQHDLDRDVAPELRVARAIDLAHPAGPKQGQNFIRAKARAGL